MMRLYCVLALALALAGICSVASAAEVRSGTIVVTDAWARATTSSAKAGGAFLKIANEGPAADRLVSAATDNAQQTQLHATRESEGVMRMHEVEGGVLLPPGETVEFRPGGYHIMLMGLKQPLTAGNRFPLTLTFERAGSVRVPVEVRPANYAPAASPQRHGQHGMPFNG